VDEYIEWWSPVTPHYEEKRTVELIELVQAELKNARAALGNSRIGYKYSDDTTFKIKWGVEVEECGQDVVYELQGNGFYLEFRMTGPRSDDDAMLYDYSWGDIVEEYLWIDSVDGDEHAKAWLTNPPERSIIDLDTYRSWRPTSP
jgi:hypothetical protein